MEGWTNKRSLVKKKKKKREGTERKGLNLRADEHLRLEVLTCNGKNLKGKRGGEGIQDPSDFPEKKKKKKKKKKKRRTYLRRKIPWMG